MRLSIALLAALALAAPAVAKKPIASWGKAGITLAQYRADALTCGRAGYYRDISDTDAAKAFVRGSRELEDMTQSGFQTPPGGDPVAASIDQSRQYEQVRRSVQPERRMAEIRDVLQSTIDECLAGRGYHRFRLTAAQQDRLDDLKPGSDARRAYLHSLASDPAILAHQAE